MTSLRKHPEKKKEGRILIISVSVAAIAGTSNLQKNVHRTSYKTAEFFQT